jgi:diphthamide synthase (EF-2-diphthine--ammonia ligase)
MSTTSNQILMSWSTGKDSAYALHTLKSLGNDFEISGILTTITKPFDRASIHGIRRELVEAQAKQMGLPIHFVEIPYPCTK